MRYKDRNKLGNREKAYNYLTQEKGLQPHIAAAAIGNFMQEAGSSLNTGAYNPDDLGKESFGLAQWRGDRFNKLKKFAGDRINTLEGQLDFLVHELKTTEKRAAQKLQETKTPEEAALIFSKYYERPHKDYAHNDKRVQNAINIFSQFSPKKEKKEISKEFTTQAIDNTQVATRKFLEIPNVVTDDLTDFELPPDIPTFTASIPTKKEEETEESKQVMSEVDKAKESIQKKQNERNFLASLITQTGPRFVGEYQEGGQIGEDEREFISEWFNNDITREKLSENLRSYTQAQSLINRGIRNVNQTDISQEKPLDEIEGVYNNRQITLYGDVAPETVAHEYTHALGDIDKQLSDFIIKRYGTPLSALRQNVGIDDTTPLEEGVSRQFSIDPGTMFGRNKIQQEIEHGQYLGRNGELYPRFMEMRNFLNVQPGQEITDEQIQQLQEDDRMSKMFNYYTPKEIKEILNTVAETSSDNSLFYAQREGASYVGTESKKKRIIKKLI